MANKPVRSSAGQLGLWDDRFQAELRQAAAGVRVRPSSGIIPTGSIAVDLALGIGGLPRGRIVELYGPPGVGKTTFALQVIAEAQRDGETAAFVDAEHCFDASYAQHLGVDLAGLILVRSEEGEHALRIIEQLAASQAVDAIVLDSVAALAPEDNRSALPDQSPFAHSEMVARGLRRIARAIGPSPACLLLINQLRTYQGFGYTETTTGGWSVKLHAAIRADMRNLGRVQKQTRRVGMNFIKNQLAPARQAEFDFEEGHGFSAVQEVLELGIKCGVLENASGQVRFGSEPVDSYRLREDAEMLMNISAAIRERMGLPSRKPVHRAPAQMRSEAHSG